MAKSNEEMFTELVAIMDEIESTQCLYDFFDKPFVNKFYDVKDEIKFIINDDYWNDADEPKTYLNDPCQKGMEGENYHE